MNEGTRIGHCAICGGSAPKWTGGGRMYGRWICGRVQCLNEAARLKARGE